MLYIFLLLASSVGEQVEEDCPMLVSRLDIPRLFADELWQHCLEDFLMAAYDRSTSYETFRIYRMILSRFFVDPARTPDDYSTHEASLYLHSGHGRTGKPISSATLNQRRAVLSGFYAYASRYPVKRDGKPEPLFSSIAPTANLRRRKPARNYKALSIEEIEHFFQAIEDIMVERVCQVAYRYNISFDREKFARMTPGWQAGYITKMSKGNATRRAHMMHPFLMAQRDRALYYLYLTSSRRRDELRLLRWQDVERATFVEQGIARKGYLFRFHRKGCGEHLDACEMAESAHALIVRYLTFSDRMETIEPEDYVFVGMSPPQGGGHKTGTHKPMVTSSLQLSFRRYADRASIAHEKTLHSLRHSSAKARYEQTKNIQAVQRALRHASIATTDAYLAELVTPPDPEVVLLERQFAGLVK